LECRNEFVEAFGAPQVSRQDRGREFYFAAARIDPITNTRFGNSDRANTGLDLPLGQISSM